MSEASKPTSVLPAIGAALVVLVGCLTFLVCGAWLVVSGL